MNAASEVVTEAEAHAPRSPWRSLVGLLAVALLARVAYLIEQPSFPYFHKPETDAWLYHLGAKSVASGDLLLGHDALRMSPGYFYFLGFVYSVFGEGPLAPRLVQIALGACVVALVWDAARRLWGPRWALVPGYLCALYGPALYFEGHLLSESLATFLHALLVWQSVRVLSASETRTRDWALIGVCWGACTVVRPNAAILVVPIVVACVERMGANRRASRVLLALGASFAMCVAPITLRNIVASGEPVLLTAHGGLNFYVGNGPGATGTFRVPSELPAAGGPEEQFAAFHSYAESALGRRLDARQADAYWYRRTWQAVRDEPMRWLKLVLRKFQLFWNGRELHNVYDYEFIRELSVVLGLPIPQFLWLAPFGLVGSLWMLARRGALRFIGVFNMASCAALVAVFVTDRYRLPVLASLSLASCFTLREGWQLWARRDPKALGLLATALVLAGALAWPVKVNKRYPIKYELLGDAYRRSNQAEFAEWAYQQSLRVQPDYEPSRFKLAELYVAAGATPLALEQLRLLEQSARAAGHSEVARKARAGMDRLSAGTGVAPP